MKNSARLIACLALCGCAVSGLFPPASWGQSLPAPSPLKRFLWSRQSQQDSHGFYYQPTGLCEDYPQEARTQARLTQDMKFVRASGAKLLRVGISWQSIERRPGQYDWAFWDRLVAAASRYDIVLLPYVCYTPRWAASEQNEFWKQPPADPAAFGGFMCAIAGRYRGRIRSWELWNEPDNRDFWLGTPAQYVQLVQAGAQGVRAADPNAVVVLGGLAGGRDPFWTALRTQYHIGDIVDIVNTHGYFETWSPNRTEDYPAYLADLAETLAGPHPPPDVWMAEFGYSDLRPDTANGTPGNVPTFFAYEHTPIYQAAQLFKSHVLALASGRLSLTAWYRINDLAPTTAVIGDAHNRHLGIVTVGGHPKPAFYALRLYNRLFDSPTRCIDDAVTVTAPPHSQAVVHVFEKRTGELLIAAWLRSPRPDEVSDHSGSAQDRRRETISLVLPGGRKTRLTVYGLTGQTILPHSALAGNTLRPIVLTGASVFIAKLMP